MCQGEPLSPDGCTQVGGWNSNSYTLVRNQQYKIYAFVDHGRRSECSFSITFTSQLGIGSGGGSDNEATAPDPRWWGYGLQTTNTTGTYRVSITGAERCTGYSDNPLNSGVINLTVQ